MRLERGAAKVYVADEMGFEHTMTKHWKTGKFEGFDKDHTIKSFKKTGIYETVRSIGDQFDARDRIHITTFREEGWRRHEFTAGAHESSSNGSTLYNKWVRWELR